MTDTIRFNFAPVANLDIQMKQAGQMPIKQGLSAYEVAVANGFVGTEAEWLATLVGEQGDQGPVGPAGIQGEAGVDGSIKNLHDAGSSATTLVWDRAQGVDGAIITLTGATINVPVPANPPALAANQTRDVELWVTASGTDVVLLPDVAHINLPTDAIPNGTTLFIPGKYNGAIYLWGDPHIVSAAP